MQFKEWILQEGWGIDLSKVPWDELLHKMSKGAAGYIGRTASYPFQAKNSPGDLIQIKPVSQVKELPSIPLSDGENARIYYAFQFVPFEKWNNPAASQSLGVNDRQRKTFRFINDMVGKDPMLAKMIRTAQPSEVQRRMNQLDSRGWVDIDVIAIYQKWITKGDKQDAQMNRVQNMADSASKLPGYGQQISPELYKEIKLSFAKAIKDPQSPAMTAVRDNVISKSIELFAKFHGADKFDYVVYPQSSSEFNKVMGEELANHLGIKAIQGFAKNPPELQTINTIQMRKDFEAKKGRRKPVGDLVKSRTERIRNTLRDKIHGVDPELRQYVGVFRPDHKIGNKYFANKRLIIIDDNVATSATFQMLHRMVNMSQPKSVVIFSPLYIG